MSFSFAVWNIEKFNYAPQRVKAVGNLIKKHDPDAFGVLEFLAKDAARKLVRSEDFKDYDFAFTDSKQGVEILVGWKRKKFAQVLYTQRREFQVGNISLRPGGLLSVLEKDSEQFTNILFLHTDSGTDPEAFANRQTMFDKIWGLKKALQSLPEQNGNARFVALGDLNTMGQKNAVSAAEEIAQLDAQATANGMRMLVKTHDKTWSSDGVRKSNLDHVLASADLSFTPQVGGNAGAEVLIDGWVNRSGQERLNFVKNISDHCLLFVEVQ
jgi:hypothetical protein